MTQDELDAAIAALPGDKVTKEQMEARVASIDFFHLGETVTICSITLDNGYSVRGESACVDPANYNQAIGEQLAQDHAFNQLWPLFVFCCPRRAIAGVRRCLRWWSPCRCRSPQPSLGTTRRHPTPARPTRPTHAPGKLCGRWVGRGG